MTAFTASPARLGAAALLLALFAGGAGYGLAHLQGPPMKPAPPEASARKVLYWYDPMVPAQHFDKPGKSPFMDMQLVPRFADEASGGTGAVVSATATQSLGVRLASVERGDLAQGVDATGALDFNERDVAIVQARAGGFVQRVYGRAPGDLIAAGAPIADLLVPSWAGAQGEYLAARNANAPGLETAARQRLRLLGMPEGLIDRVARRGQPQTTVTITTPIGGTIQSLDVRQGMTVNAGQTLAQVNGLGSVWLNAAVPEAQAGQVRVGQAVAAELPAFPGQVFNGRVAAVLPAAQADSRTVTVRTELANPGGRLRPGMFATVHLRGAARPALLIPSEAVIRTGKRSLVMLAADNGSEGDGHFQAVEVQVGHEDGGRTEILAGLDEGQKVVASGQFLIDSEASLAGLQPRPLPVVPSAPGWPALYEAAGRIEALSGDQITISHGPVPELGWPAMTMGFRLDPSGLAKSLKVGDHIRFGFAQQSEGPVVRRLAKDAGQ